MIPRKQCIILQSPCFTMTQTGADAIQEAIVKAFVKLHTLKDDSYAKTWLIRIVMNECYAIMRKEKKIISLRIIR